MQDQHEKNLLFKFLTAFTKYAREVFGENELYCFCFIILVEIISLNVKLAFTTFNYCNLHYFYQLKLHCILIQK